MIEKKSPPYISTEARVFGKKGGGTTVTVSRGEPVVSVWKLSQVGSRKERTGQEEK